MTFRLGYLLTNPESDNGLPGYRGKLLPLLDDATIAESTGLTTGYDCGAARQKFTINLRTL